MNELLSKKEDCFENGFLLMSKDILLHYGYKVAIIHSYLVDQYKYFKRRGLLRPDGSFYCLVGDIKKYVGCCPKTQLKILKTLENLGLITIYYDGFPKVRYVKINKLD